MAEAEIIVDGKKLSEEESRVVRIALCNFISDLKDSLGENVMGKEFTEGYMENCNSVLKKMDMFN